ncbi:C40 family peptidase [Streptomyces sp. NPDC001939]
MNNRQPRRRSRRLLKCGLIASLLLALTVSCMAPLSGAADKLSLLAQQGSTDVDLAGAGTSKDIPPRMQKAYDNAVQMIGSRVPKCRGMRWPILAGIAKVESNHARGRDISSNGDIHPKIYGVLLNGSGVGGNTSVFTDTDGGKWDGNAAGERAVGPFQFMPATWESTGQDGNKDGDRDPHNADDAALGAAVYLCGRGRNLADASQLRAAIFQYNHSNEYVANVTGWIRQYSAATGPKGVTGKTRTVIEAALSQLGKRYSWGGGNAGGASTGSCCSPSGKSGVGIKGFDCSGLTMYAFARAGIPLGRPASAQAGRGRRIPASAGQEALRPGDLVFFTYAPGQDSRIYHVGIYLGGGQMVNAARPGTVVRKDPVYAMPGYAGGARLL